MQFKVPQNVTMEDRIAGPLTLVQFGILVVGGGIAYVIFNITVIAPFNSILAITVALLAALLSIGKFNDQPLYRFFRYIILFFTTPRTRVWHKSGGEVELIKPSQKPQKDASASLSKHVSKTDIARLAVVLDSRGSAAIPPQISATKKG